MTLRDTIAANLRVLIDEKTNGLSTIRVAAAKAGIGNGTLGRMCKPEKQEHTDLLEKVASAFGLEPWQLLVPGLAPNALPVAVRSDWPAWPFSQFSQERFYALTEAERGMVDKAARDELERLERDRARRQPLKPVAAEPPPLIGREPAVTPEQVKTELARMKASRPPKGGLPPEQAKRASAPDARPPSAKRRRGG